MYYFWVLCLSQVCNEASKIAYFDLKKAKGFVSRNSRSPPTKLILENLPLREGKGGEGNAFLHNTNGSRTLDEDLLPNRLLKRRMPFCPDSYCGCGN